MDVGTKGKAVEHWAVAIFAGVSFALGADWLMHPAPPLRSQAQAAVLQQASLTNTSLSKFGNDELPAPVPVVAKAPSPPPHRTEQQDAADALKASGVPVTPDGLAESIRAGELAKVSLLLKAGVDPNAYDSAGNPMMITACRYDRVPIAQKLIQAGGDVNYPGVESRTALMEAAFTGDTQLLDVLQQSGAILDIPDVHGHNALSYAVFGRAPAAIAWLLNYGVTLSHDCCADSGSTFTHALETADCTVIEPIINYEHPTEWSKAATDTLLSAIKRGDKPLARLLLTHHPVPPSPPNGRQSMVAYAVVWGGDSLLNFLLECGADPNAALQRPVESAFTKLLHDESLEYYAQKEDNLTPLMIAAGLGKIDYVQALLHNGAKRGMLTSRSKMAALSLAANHNNTDIMQVLLGKSPRPEDQHIRVEISLGMQQVSLWKDGRIVLTSPISTGRYGFPTPTGRFVITDKQRLRSSSIYKVPMPYFMRLSCSEVGMHAGVVPNYPASHGCIRLPESTAIKIFHTVDEGTLVMIDP